MIRIYWRFFVITSYSIHYTKLYEEALASSGEVIPDLLLFALVGGFAVGIGLGLVFRSGATTGGSDLLAGILNHFFPWMTVGRLLLYVDGVIIVCAAVVFQSFRLGLYAVVSMYRITSYNVCYTKLLREDRKVITVSKKNLVNFLGIKRYHYDKACRIDEVGIARGLAWTPVGGDTLSIEVNLMKGEGKIELTGQLGDVMKESAKIAISYIRSRVV